MRRDRGLEGCPPPSGDTTSLDAAPPSGGDVGGTPGLEAAAETAAALLPLAWGGEPDEWLLTGRALGERGSYDDSRPAGAEALDTVRACLWLRPPVSVAAPALAASPVELLEPTPTFESSSIMCAVRCRHFQMFASSLFNRARPAAGSSLPCRKQGAHVRG